MCTPFAPTPPHPSPATQSPHNSVSCVLTTPAVTYVFPTCLFHPEFSDALSSLSCLFSCQHHHGRRSLGAYQVAEDLKQSRKLCVTMISSFLLWQNKHKIFRLNPVKLHDSEALSTLIVLCIYCQCLFSGRLHTPRRNPAPLKHLHKKINGLKTLPRYYKTTTYLL